MTDYRSFLASKRSHVPDSGFDVPTSELNPRLFPWQRDIVRWSLRKGRAALFEDCGLGKTAQQLVWADHVCRRTGGLVLLLAPLAVNSQTIQEAAKFGIESPIAIAESRDGIPFLSGIVVTNYEKLHKFNPSKFKGVVLDESSILKSYTGATKRKLLNAFCETPYRLACTATPAPNDRKELGNHAEFLGAMASNEMLARWFINDTMKAGGYRLKKHAASDFWRWVASWAVAISKPSDLGHSDDGFAIPPLNIHEHIIETSVPAGFLFHPGGKVSATEVHQEKRSSLDERCDFVASLVNDDHEPWAVWCDTDYESKVLCDRIPDAIEVKGSHPDYKKAERLSGFSEGRYRIIVTKPEIGGFGLNWQHCRKTTWFAGYSFERFYQSIRRLWRFGQKFPVECHVVMSESEQSISEVVKRKSREHSELQAEMAIAMQSGSLEEIYGRVPLADYNPQIPMEIPQWLCQQSPQTV